MVVLTLKRGLLFPFLVSTGFLRTFKFRRGIAVPRFNVVFTVPGNRDTVLILQSERGKSLLKYAFLSGLALATAGAWGQTAAPVIKAGTVVNLEPVSTVLAREVDAGAVVKFRVKTDVKQQGEVLVPAGTMADGVVTEAKKSSIAGTKGRLTVDFRNLTLEDGTVVPLTGTARAVGKNRTPLAVTLCVFVWPCIFIPGTKAMLVEGQDFTATVAANTELSGAQ